MAKVERVAAGLLLITAPAIFIAAFSILGAEYDYPEILRREPAAIFEMIERGGDRLLALWYSMFAASLLIIPIAVLLRRAMPKESAAADLSAVFGVLAGLVQAMGFLRWIMLNPTLAAAYADPNANGPGREAIAAVFAAFHAYLGVGVGEHLGYLFTGLWTVFVVIGLRGRLLILRLVGGAAAVGVLAGLLEPFGVAGAAELNAVAYSVWALWLVVLGAAVAFGRDASARS